MAMKDTPTAKSKEATEKVAEEKSPWKSKTIWVNLAALLSMAIPAVRDWLATNPVEIVSFLAAVGVVLRFVTHGKVSIFGKGQSSAANLCLLGLAGVAAFGLSACARPVELVYHTTYGAKAGMKVGPVAEPSCVAEVPVVVATKEGGKSR
jgi:hypothetical protein